jgi:hypothetical protein
MGNEDLGPDHKEQLMTDIAEVLRVSPDALGLVKEATSRGQRNALASRGKLGTGAGTAYEIMGAAQLVRRPSTARDSEAVLSITPGQDRVDFGIKLQASYADDERKLFQDRKTIEADLLISKPSPEPREVAVDFKHAKNAGGFSDKSGREKTLAGISDLATQLKGVVNALRTGEIDEFHFATNGHFTDSFTDAIKRTNEELQEADLTPISLHEHVIAAALQDGP